MCGINGFNWRGISLIEKMNESIKHRGPDGKGVYIDDKVSLGHVRLSILDLSSAGKQPMSNEDESVWIIYNGEVYNFLGLRKELEERGHKFKSNTDTEVVLHAYEEWGYDCIESFNGMWAFAVYDKNRDTLFLSRDRFGIKPLYYYCDGNKFIFSSEPKGILQHGINRIPNDKVIYEFLVFGLSDHSRETFFKDIYRVMPGENLIYDFSEKALKTLKWYDLKSKIGKIEQKDENKVKEEIQKLFADSIRYRLIADVPVGSCLSGGIDSSAIVCTMDKLWKNNKIKTFSLVFPGLKIDESSYIDEVVKATNIESHKISLSVRDMIEDLHDLIWTQDEPFGSLSIYGQYKVMELAYKNDTKVLLDGQGGDELFAGYTSYHRHFLFECLMNRKFDNFLKSMQYATQRKEMIKLILSSGLFFLRKLRLLKDMGFGKPSFLKDFYSAKTSYPPFESGFNLNHVLLNDMTIYSIPNLLRYEDRNSMRWGIESRVPFLDYRFVEFVFSLPSDYKIKGGITKYIFRKMLSGVVPRRILERRDKIGFAAPDKEWFRSPEFISVVREITDSSKFKSRKYWRHEKVKEIFVEHLNGKKDHSRELWRIINTELWLRVFIDGMDEPKIKEETTYSLER